jgi:signal transduction histidine kinase
MTESAGKSFRILFVEDSELDYELILAGLKSASLVVTSKRVESETELHQALSSEEWDLVISDHLLPQLSAERALEIVKGSGKDLPFIIVSGQMGEDLAVESMRNGADDYLVKGRLKRLPVAIERSIEAAKTRAARITAQQNLQNSERRLRAFAMHLTDVRERDRAAIRTEVHDEIGGNLLAARFALTRLEKLVAAGTPAERSPPQLETDIREAAELVQKAVDASQKLYTSLRSNLLDQGIVAALEWRLTQLQKRSGIIAHLSASPAEFPLPENVALAAYVAAVELIENVEMHARSRNIWCAVFYIDGSLTIEIRDDGQGCSLKDLMNPTKFGVFSARERIGMVGGSLDFDTTYTGLETGTAALITINHVDVATASEVSA